MIDYQRWTHTDTVLSEVASERAKQDEKWGEQNHPDLYPGSHNYTYYAGVADYWKRKNEERVAVENAKGVPSDRNAAWDGVLLEEVFEALAESDPAKRRAELVQVAAVAVNMIEAIDRRSS